MVEPELLVQYADDLCVFWNEMCIAFPLTNHPDPATNFVSTWFPEESTVCAD